MARYEVTTEPGAINFECVEGTVERILQNCKNLIRLRKGEIAYDRMRGLDPALFQLPFTEAQDRLLPELDRALAWENRSEVVSGTIYRDSEGETVVRCVVDVRG